MCASAATTSAGSPDMKRAVEPAEGVAEVADRRSEHRADDVQFGRVGAAHLGGPRAGQAATGVAPQADRRRPATGPAAPCCSAARSPSRTW